MKTKFLVEHHFSYGWDDAGWSTTEGYGTMVPELFDTREEAQAAIDDLIKGVAEAVAEGDMSDEYDAEGYHIPEKGNICTAWERANFAQDYRIVEVDPATWRREE